MGLDRKIARPLIRAPSGRYLCRYCDQETRPPRRTFCSDACVHEWRLRSDPSYLRTFVYKRDRGVCAFCGQSTERLRRTYQAELAKLSRAKAMLLAKQLGLGANRIKYVKKRLRLLPLWDADHIVPVHRGGGGCGLETIQTLCLWCHRQKTARDRVG